jgi:flagellar hook-basal body complex protein FliE
MMMLAFNMGGTGGLGALGGFSANDAWTQLTEQDGAFGGNSQLSAAGLSGAGLSGLTPVTPRRRIKQADGLEATTGDTDKKNDQGLDFASSLKQSLEEVNRLQNTAHNNVQDYAVGKDVPLHQVMISVTEAEQSLQLATQVRNKLINAYQDIKNMPI